MHPKEESSRGNESSFERKSKNFQEYFDDVEIDKEAIQKLPAAEIAERVNELIDTHNRLIITAPPGAGKSTLLPLTMLKEQTRIIMLEPRRLAARQVAHRMAELLGEQVGETVGYRVRFDSRVSERTRIEVLTEGMLTRRLVEDPTLDGVNIVIFDEFHERSLQSDLALALVREAQSILRDDLRIVIMSATIDTDVIAAQLGAPVIESKGRMFPVDTKHVATDTADTQELSKAIIRAHNETTGDILVFLPGQAEILSCQDLLQRSLPSTIVAALYGQLSLEEQRRAILPSPNRQRRIVLSTNIAETSLTIEGISVVVDSGLCRTMVFDTQSQLSRLATVPISMDMANQRRGRAGRLSQGTCYRLWTAAEEHRMAENRRPEVLDADLAPLLLQVAAWGESNPEALPWLTPLPHSSVLSAHELLFNLGAIKEDGSITPHGKRMASMPCHPRIANMLLSARDDEERSLASDIAALLEEKLTFSASNTPTDIYYYIVELREHRNRHNNVQRVAKEYAQLLHVKQGADKPVEASVGRLLCAAYPERIARRTERIGQFRLANGRLGQVDVADELASQEWIVIAQMNAAPNANAAGKIFLASPTLTEVLKDFAHERERISWDSKAGRILAQRESFIGLHIVSSIPIYAKLEQILPIVSQAIKKEGASLLDLNEDFQRLQLRIEQVRTWLSNEAEQTTLPNVSTPTLLAKADEWLQLFITDSNHLRICTDDLKRIDMCQVVWSQLSYEQQQLVDRLAPTHITVPTGSRIRLDYRQGAEAPVLSVRLQECFGMTSTPLVNDGKQPVLMELLSPGFKPVQLTKDLSNFWTNTYFEVRKELRRRYPKHYWPDNPLEAEPTRKAKPRN